MENKVPTAEDFINLEKYSNIGHGSMYIIYEALIEFAKLHCIEQARIISETKVRGIYGSNKEFTRDFSDIESILNAYPLENIK